MARMFAKNGMTIVRAGFMIALMFPVGSVYAQANHSDFFLIFASDPQIGYCDSPQCQTGQDGLEQSKTWNKAHLSSIAKFVNKPNDFLGLVIDGDLTNTGEDAQLKYFEHTYMNTPHLQVYPGLGNHDYFPLVACVPLRHASNAFFLSGYGGKPVDLALQYKGGKCPLRFE